MPFVLIVLLLFAFPANAITQYFTVGPEIYTLKREREGGTRQRGTLYGFRTTYEAFLPYHLYVGAVGAYARGTLTGKSGADDRLHSRFTDSMVEGRLGFLLQSCSGCCGWLVPFAGGGYFWENNNYIGPSPKHLRFRNRYGYFAAGCVAGTWIGRCLMLGLDATARFSLQGRVRISHDPDNDPVTLKYEQKVNCRVALPLTYGPCDCCYDCSLVPFFEYRHYGRRHAFPFDFLDTRIKVYGVDLVVTFHF